MNGELFKLLTLSVPESHFESCCLVDVHVFLTFYVSGRHASMPGMSPHSVSMQRKSI